MMVMKIVAVFLSDPMTLRRLVLAFRNRCVVQAFTHVDEIRDLANAGKIIATIVDMRPRSDLLEGLALDLIARLHATYPAIPVSAYVDFSPQRARDILAAAHAGASDIILRENDDLNAVAERVFDMGTSIDVASRLKIAIEGMVPTHLHEFFIFCVRHATSGITVEGVAARLRRNRKTLSNWLVLAHLPPPYRIIGWIRILVAARLLEDSSRSLEKVARELRFVSGTALRNMIKRYLGVNPDTLRKLGGFEFALAKFVDVLAESAAKRALKP
jgi:AraC-like DNA-binding protein